MPALGAAARYDAADGVPSVSVLPPLRVGRLHVSIERLELATVVLRSVLVGYDGRDDLATFGGVAAVSNVLLAAVAPLVILGIGRVSPIDTRSTIGLLLWTGVLTLLALVARGGARGAGRRHRRTPRATGAVATHRRRAR